jgi:short-subunit dehydrogenase
MATVSDRKLAVVTGASSGIGFELARQCAAHGYDLVVCAEDPGIQSAADQIAQEHGVSVRAVQQDLSTYEGCEALGREIVGTGRPIDALLLNAGFGVGGAFVDTQLEAELQMIALNCGHTVHLAKLVLPEMIAAGKGRVLITGSIVSTSPAPFHAVYGATKAFVMSFGEAIRKELEDTGVTVTVIQPGPTDTNFFERAHMEDTKVGQADKDDPADVARRGFDAMIAGKASVLAGGLKSKLQGLGNEILPETVKASAAAKQAEPKPKH